MWSELNLGPRLSQMERPELAYALGGLLIVQGLAMLVDEFYFHHRRGLGRWERIGHPVDTLMFMLALGVLLQSGWSLLSASLAIFSALLVTKDEWVHRREAPAAEQWLHSILFLLHGLILGLAGELGEQVVLSAGATLLLLAPIGMFFFYQVLYWQSWRLLRSKRPSHLSSSSGRSPHES